MTLDADGLRVVISGRRTADPLLLVNSVGCTLEMWNDVVSVLDTDHRVIRFDARGHGRSFVPPGPYTLDDLGADARRVLDAAGADTAHVCGVSMGGVVGLWLAVNERSRVGRVVLANTAARIGTRVAWLERAAAVDAGGMSAISDLAVGRFFSDNFRRRSPDVVEDFRASLEAMSPDGYSACCRALADADLRPRLDEVDVPTLVIAGSDDIATPPADSEALAAAIRGSRLVLIEGVGHLSNVERPAAFAQALAGFLGE